MNEQPTHIDLFSGIGGFAIAAQRAGFRTIAFCEIEHYCQAILKARFGTVEDAQVKRCLKAGSQQSAASDRPRLHGDIFKLDGSQYRGVSLLTGGFPCQPFSVAGKRAGAEDDRFLWPEMLRVVSEARPAWVLGENVPGIIGMELDRVLSDLEGIGYACWPLVIPACAVDARHRRDRVWIVAHHEREGLVSASAGPRGMGAEKHGEIRERIREAPFPIDPSCTPEPLANSISAGLEVQQCQPRDDGRQQQAAKRGSDQWCRWEPEPNVGRVANGVPARVDRLKGLGNAIVPQVAFQILKTIRELI